MNKEDYITKCNQKKLEILSLEKEIKEIFGNDVWVHVPKEKRRKLDMKSRHGIFVGYTENTKGYRVFFPDVNMVSIEREIIFTPELVRKNAGDNEESLVRLQCNLKRNQKMLYLQGTMKRKFSSNQALWQKKQMIAETSNAVRRLCYKLL
ncbi:hypothetical protein QE152_g21992 [Popillia japonica]|uniref:Retroviral polymerase SH3-like domain-containing protein n=1 Tax=Popillia japonica TaxID=7064 RepID=A0AAW1KM88_POPJA